MAVLRWTVQVRSTPERLMEWALLFVPLDLFEAGLQRFGFDAKRYALFGAIAASTAVLTLLGAVALRRAWPPRGMVALGLGLWLFAMVVVMPLTSAGLFAADLVDSTRKTILGYLGVCLTYAAVLALADLLLGKPAEPTTPVTSVSVLARALRTGSWRRDALVTLAGAAAAFAATYVVEVTGPRRTLTAVRVLDPQEPLPSGGIDPPNPHPDKTDTRSDSGPDPAAAQAQATGSPGARPASQTTAGDGASGLPEPPPARQLARDKDGAVLTAGRRPGELAPYITSNQNFYIVTKNAGGDPVLSPRDWRLRIDGEVQRGIELDYQSLRNLPAVEVTKTLECISNFVAKCELAPFGCDLISTARWKGVRLSDVLQLAGGLKPNVHSLATIGGDEFTAALPMEAALDPETLVAYEMNGQMLPREHGYPVRILVPGRYGMKNAKWVVAIRAMGREFVDWYGQRQWSKQAIVKTMTRIDSPAPGAELPPGEHRLAGIAYAGDRGISKVEFSDDEGTTWKTATILEPPAGRDTWARWEGTFTLDASAAPLTIIARATDGTGALQIEEFSLPQPDGGSGWHTLEVRTRQA